MPDDPPAWPKVIGILSIVFSSIGLVCGGCGLAVTPFLGQFILGQFMSGVAQSHDLPPPYQPNLGTMAYGGLGVLNALLLLIAGVMVLKRKPIGRPLHLVCATISIPLTIIGLYLQWRLQQENVAWAQQADPANPFAKQFQSPGASIGNTIGLIFGGVIGLSYPLFLLIWFGLVKRKATDMGKLPE